MDESDERPSERAAAAVRERLAAAREQAQGGPRGAPPSRIPRCAPPVAEPPLTAGAGEAYGAALAQLERSDLDAAETQLRLALARDDHRPEPWLELGILLVEGSRFDEALRPLQRAMELDPEGYEARRFLALCHQRTGRDPEAILAYRDFLERCPEQHQKVRLHAQRSLESLERSLGAAPAEDAESGLEEVPHELDLAAADREAGRRVRVGVAVLGALLLWGLLPGAGSSPAGRTPGPGGAVGSRAHAREVEDALEALRQGQPEALARLGGLVSRWRGEPVSDLLEEAVAALVEVGSLEAAEQLVNAYAAASRSPRQSSRVRVYLGVLAEAVRRLDPGLAREAVGRAQERVSPPRGPADRQAGEALGSLREGLAG